MQTLPEYLTKKFVDWQASEGERKTLIQFAEYLKVSRSLLSYWMNGARKPSENDIEKIALVYGNEIYDILSLPRPNPYLQAVVKHWEFMSEEKQAQISRMIAEEAAKYEAKKSSDRVQKIPK